ncbi:melanopsin-like [Rhinoraja longicauda]
MESQSRAANEIDIPDYVHYVICCCIFVIGTTGVLVNLSVVYAFYRTCCFFAGCQLYGFCGALLGITSMITLMAITIDRYWVITKPLQCIGLTRKKNTQQIILAVWLYLLAWSLPPQFGWTQSHILQRQPNHI